MQQYFYKGVLKDYYLVLQLQPEASPAAITAAYRALCKMHHPDAGGDAAHMVRINEAYDVLKDPDQRKAYDRHYAARGRQESTTPPEADKAQPRRHRYSEIDPEAVIVANKKDKVFDVWVRSLQFRIPQLCVLPGSACESASNRNPGQCLRKSLILR